MMTIASTPIAAVPSARWALGAMALTAPTLRAQQGDANWQRIVAAAKKEGSLVIYHQAVPQVLDRVYQGFHGPVPRNQG